MEEVSYLWSDLDTQIKTQCPTVFVDNCCSIRGKIKEIIPNAVVKLDTFHALQRISRSIPHKTKGKRQFLRDLSAIFRKLNRKGKKTLFIKQMLTRFDILKRTYTKKLPSLLRKKAMDALKNLRVHIKEGCLSETYPKGGTNHNENLHRILRRKVVIHKTLSVNVVGSTIARNLCNYNCEKITKKQTSLLNVHLKETVRFL